MPSISQTLAIPTEIFCLYKEVNWIHLSWLQLYFIWVTLLEMGFIFSLTALYIYIYSFMTNRWKGIMKLVSNWISLSDQVAAFVLLSTREVCFRDFFSLLVSTIVFPSDAHLALWAFYKSYMCYLGGQIWKIQEQILYYQVSISEIHHSQLQVTQHTVSILTLNA